MVTRIVDMTSYEGSEKLQKLQNILIGRAECAYIFPESLSVGTEGQENVSMSLSLTPSARSHRN